MTLKEIDSSKLLFDIHSKDLVEQFKAKFTGFEDYTGQIDEKKVIQYIILMYDMQSPLIKSKPDYFQRKFECALLVKFPTHKKEFTEEVDNILVGKDDVVNHTIVSYILSYGLPSYGLFQAFAALIAFEMQKIYAGKGTKDSQTILDKATLKIQTLERELFRSGNEDEFYRVRQALYSRAEKERENLKPEHLIRTLEDTGELPEGFSPYPDGYKINPKTDFIFLGDK